MGEKQTGDERVTRLLDMLVEEVSLVDRAANQRKWLLRKREDEMGDTIFEVDEVIDKADKIAPPVKTAVKSAIVQCLARLDATIGAVKAATDDANVSGMPGTLSSAIKTVAVALRGTVEKYPTPQAKSDGEGDTEIEKMAIDPGLRAKVVDVLEQVRNRLASLGVAVDGLTEDESASGVPQSVSQEAGALATALESLLQRYPSPKAKAEDGENVEKIMTAWDAVQQARLLIKDAFAKIEPGKPLAEDAYQKLDKLRSVLSLAAPARTVSAEAAAANEANKGGVEKAGQKMSAARRKKFEEAIKSLLGLFKEVLPPREADSWPHLVTKREQEKSEIDGLRAKVEALSSELSALKASPQPSNVSTVETVEKNENDGQVSWPMDLNAEK